MKNLLIILAVLLPISTYANQPIKLLGAYAFKKVEAIQIRDEEVVHISNKPRYHELLKDRYQCVLRANFYLCKKFIKDAKLPVSLEAELVSEWTGKFFEFQSGESLPEITNESPSLNEWKIFDSVNYEGQFAPDYDYYLLKGETNLHKISIHFPNSVEWLILESESNLSKTLQKSQKLSKDRTRIYLVSLYFMRLN